MCLLLFHHRLKSRPGMVYGTVGRWDKAVNSQQSSKSHLYCAAAILPKFSSREWQAGMEGCVVGKVL